MSVSAPRPHLNLLGGFELWLEGEPVPVSSGSQRLVAFLALNDRLLARSYVAGMMWPEVVSDRANANLRAGLWRLPRECRRLVELSARHLRLSHGVSVDLRSAAALAHQLLDRARHIPNDDLSGAARVQLSRDLLPTWYDDDWVAVERERFYQLRLHALEALCERLTAAGRHGEAVDAGLAAVRAEPLRESAHRALIKAYLAEGNHGEAGRQYQRCRSLLLEELGVEPSGGLRDLLATKARELVTATAD